MTKGYAELKLLCVALSFPWLQAWTDLRHYLQNATQHEN